MAYMPFVPNVIVVGFEKAGTSYLNECLARNDSFLTPERKETFFFDRHFDEGLDFFRGLYKPERKPRARFICDVTPSYRRKKEFMARIRETVPDAKILVVLRNPVSRAYSHYVWDIARTHGFKLEQPYRQSFFDAREMRNPVHFPDYLEVLAQLHELFPARNILILVNETDLDYASAEGKRKIATFFEVDDFEFAKPTRTPGKLGNRLSVFPHYLYSGARPCIHDFSGKSYSIPPHTFVFCTSKAGNVWTGVPEEKAAAAVLASTRWTRKLNAATAERIFNDLFRQTTDSLEAAYGLDLSAWRQFRDIEYPLAAPPTSFVVRLDEHEDVRREPNS